MNPMNQATPAGGGDISPAAAQHATSLATKSGAGAVVVETPKRDDLPVEAISDVINHPAHYTAGGIECIDAIQAALTPEEFRGYCKGNALKYVWRNGKKHAGTKNEDANKAIWYLRRLCDEQ